MSDKPRCLSCVHANFAPDSESGVCEFSIPQVTVIPGKSKQDGSGGFDDRIVAAQPPITLATGCSNHPKFLNWVKDTAAVDVLRPVDIVDPRLPYACNCVVLGDYSGNKAYKNKYSIISHAGRSLSILKSCKSCGGTGIPKPDRPRLEPETEDDFRDEYDPEAEDAAMGVIIGEHE